LRYGQLPLSRERALRMDSWTKGGEFDFCRFLPRRKAVSAIRFLPISRQKDSRLRQKRNSCNRPPAAIVLPNARTPSPLLDLAVKTGSFCCLVPVFVATSRHPSRGHSGLPHGSTFSGRFPRTTQPPLSRSDLNRYSVRDSKIIYVPRLFQL